MFCLMGWWSSCRRVGGQWVGGIPVGGSVLGGSFLIWLVDRWSLGQWKTCRWVGSRLSVVGSLSVVGWFVIRPLLREVKNKTIKAIKKEEVILKFLSAPKSRKGNRKNAHPRKSECFYIVFYCRKLLRSHYAEAESSYCQMHIPTTLF